LGVLLEVLVRNCIGLHTKAGTFTLLRPTKRRNPVRDKRRKKAPEGWRTPRRFANFGSHGKRFASWTAAALRRFSLPNNFHQHALAAVAVEFAVENLFPRAEIQFPFRDGHDDFAARDVPFLRAAAAVKILLPATRVSGYTPH
jgi:hypothetical protein